MKRTASTVVVALLLAAAPAGSSAASCPTTVTRVKPGRWQSRPVEGIEGASFTWDVAADEEDPRLVVVTDAAGILVTRDAGCTWTRTASFEDFVPTSAVVTEGVAVAGTGRARSLHVLVRPTSGEPRVLLSSTDDGRTWAAGDLPPPAALPVLGTVALAGGPGDERLYLLVDAGAGVSNLFASSGGEWSWKSIATPAAVPSNCAPDGPCTTAPLWKIHASGDELWALGATEATGETGLRRSRDAGASWADLAVPDLLQYAVLFDVAGDAVLLLGGFSEFAYSSDGGESWGVGKLPKLVSSTWTSAGVFDVAHFDRGRAFATVLGGSKTSEWAGNVLVFDGRKWADASPPCFAGYDRPDSFAALASTSGGLLALSSRGELMKFSR